MTVELSPLNAAKLADVPYIGFQSENLADFRERASGSIPQGFAPTGSLIRGRTGPNRTSNFAVILNREVSGGDHKVVTIRGTQSVPDWLTNLNIALMPGPGGCYCHAGFCTTYRSMIDAVRAGVGSRPVTVHVVGHSLGGALAALTALDLKNRGHSAYLYTFGAPRVGPLPFTQGISQALDGRIYRVYDRGDPVPMIPLFPFLHAPLQGNDYPVGGVRDSISVDHHDMKENYIKLAEGLGSWNALGTRYADSRLNFGPAYWLAQAAERTRIPGNAIGLWALGRALEAILSATASLIQTTVSAAMTVLDMLAWALERALELGGQVAEWVLDWMRSALRWLGREVVASAADATRVFLRYVLTLFLRHLATLAWRALEATRRRLA